MAGDPNQPSMADAPTSAYAYSPPPPERAPWPEAATPSTASGTPEHWFEPAPAGTAATEAVPPPTRRRRRGAGLGALLAVGMLSALLASGGTIAMLGAGGYLGRPAGAPGASGSPGQQTDSRSVTIDESSAVTRAAEIVSPAVVTIEATARAGGDPLELPEQGVGSGVIYDRAGWILTNRHVVCGSDSLTVTLKDGRSFPGRVYGLDTLTDLAIVRIEGSDLPAAPIGSAAGLKPGQLAIAIGSPLGEFTNSVTSGVVSALNRRVDIANDVCRQGRPRSLRGLIQTDAAINPGNSGGPLVDSAGQVIGINTAVAGRAQGIGFAIPIDLARGIMRQAQAGQPLARPYVGVFFVDVTPALAKEEKLPIDYGAWITRRGADGQVQPAVVAGGPGAAAGLKDGDIVSAIDGQRLDATHPLDLVLADRSPGDKVTLEVLRGGERLTLTVTLGTRPEEP
ncbi:MAG TPA: trypsin-like peptidase domain-containing protein [Candidatus Limnocylindrales bacterium]|nr:trypsin-like peptidase domain-containing protein [Candidatus Limnocylindrales bacterium]